MLREWWTSRGWPVLRGWPGWLGLAGPIRPLLSDGQPSFRLVKLPNQPEAFLGAQRATVLAALLQTLQLGTRCRHGDVLCCCVSFSRESTSFAERIFGTHLALQNRNETCVGA